MMIAEQSGQELFESLQGEHNEAISAEEERAQYFFTVREKAIMRVGLPEVRNYRLAKLATEKKEWQQEIESARQIIPEIRPLLLLGIMGGGV